MRTDIINKVWPGTRMKCVIGRKEYVRGCMEPGMRVLVWIYSYVLFITMCHAYRSVEHKNSEDISISDVIS